MSKANEEQQTRLERARQIGLFRYMLIREAADATLTGRQRGALVRALAAQAHTEPDGRIVRITRWTLDRWIQNYREGGFDALVPSPRQSQPRTPPEVFELAAALKKENPSRSAAQVRRILHAQLGWAPNETTLQRMFVRTGLTALRAPVEPAVFGRFEAARPNEIWTGDALHGPRIGGRKTYLSVTWNHAAGWPRPSVACLDGAGGQVAGPGSARAGGRVATDLGRSGSGTAHDRRLCPRAGRVPAGL
jgi:putative transposase